MILDCFISSHSKHTRSSSSTYKAVGQQTNLLGANHPLGYPGEAGRILAVCCGPSEEKECPVGARTTGPCAHAVAAIMASCVLPTNQVKHNLTGHYGC